MQSFSTIVFVCSAAFVALCQANEGSGGETTQAPVSSEPTTTSGKFHQSQFLQQSDFYLSSAFPPVGYTVLATNTRKAVKLVDGLYNQESAEDICENEGATLYTLQSINEFRYLQKNILPSPGSKLWSSCQSL